MKYEAILRGVSGVERPKQAFFNDFLMAEQWAEKVIGKLVDSGGLQEGDTPVVEILMQQATLVKRVLPPVQAKK